jgi:hypothetical protein
VRYRKKPVTIDAWLIADLMKLDFHELPDLVRLGVLGERPSLRFATEGLYITTLEGGMFGRPEDMLICGVVGEFYPCRPDVFAATYDAEASSEEITLR